MWILFLLSLLPSLVFAQVVDVSTSKNAVTLKGLSPHVNFIDQDGNDYFITTNGNVIRIHSNASPLINIPTDGNIGIELAPVTGVAATPIAGGSLTASTTYYFVVTALDGFGETAASNEATCTTTVANKTCQVSWTISPPPAESYRIYVGVATGAYTHYVGGIVSSPHNISSFPVLAGSPPEVTTAYRVRLSQAGVHYSDGTVQNTAGGFAAWSVDGSDIFSSQSGRIGIGDGVVFSLQSAKMNILCGNPGDGINNGHCINLNNRGTVAAYLVNDVQMRSNYNPTTGLLYDSSKSSWIFSLGNNADRSAFYRAKPTSGTPDYELVFAIDGPPDTGSVNIQNYNKLYFGTGPSLTSAGYYLFKGIAANVVQFIATSGSSVLNMLSGASNQFTIALDPSPIETRMLYKETLKFIDINTSRMVRIMGSNGSLLLDGGVVAILDMQTFGHVWGGSMSKSCNDFSMGIHSPGAYDTASVSVTLTSSNVHPFIHSFANGTFYSNNNSSRNVDMRLIRNHVDYIQNTAPMMHMQNRAGSGTVPFSASHSVIDTFHPVGPTPVVYTVNFLAGGDFVTLNYLLARVGLCVHELP